MPEHAWRSSRLRTAASRLRTSWIPCRKRRALRADGVQLGRRLRAADVVQYSTARAEHFQSPCLDKAATEFALTGIRGTRQINSADYRRRFTLTWKSSGRSGVVSSSQRLQTAHRSSGGERFDNSAHPRHGKASGDFLFGRHRRPKLACTFSTSPFSSRPKSRLWLLQDAHRRGLPSLRRHGRYRH